MSKPSQDDMKDLLEADKIRQMQQRVLYQLLGDLRSKANNHLVVQVHMGDVPSYLTSVKLSWVAGKVGFAAELPIFKESVEGSRRIQVDHETVERVQQRQPDWSRQFSMAVYLATRKHHKFPPLLLVGYQGWVYDPKDEKWGTSGNAMNDSLTLNGLDPTGAYWNLDDSDTQFYAIDGQHRLMAILGLRELIQNGQLHALSQDRNPKKGGGVSLDELITEIDKNTGEGKAVIHERLQHLMDERIGVEIIPAVLNGETFEGALRRLRQMFVDVNEHAKSLSRSELTQLDEADGYRIVSRRLLAKHPLLNSTSNGEERTKVDTTAVNLSEGSNCYTTLKALAEVVRVYLKENETLKHNNDFVSWDNLIAKGVPIRPSDEMLEEGEKAMKAYFDFVASIPSHKDFIQGKPASEIRKADDHILFRPLVQEAFAEAVGKLVAQGVSLESIKKELTRQEKQGRLRLTERKAPWFGVLCDPSSLNMRRHKKYKELCCRLFVYLLGGGIVDDFDRARLKEDFAVSRQIDVGAGVAIDLEDKQVNVAEVELPDPWR